MRLDEYEIDEIYTNRYPGHQECPTCGVGLDQQKLAVRTKFMGEPTIMEIYALSCPNCNKLVKTVACNLEFMSKRVRLRNSWSQTIPKPYTPADDGDIL